MLLKLKHRRLRLGRHPIHEPQETSGRPKVRLGRHRLDLGVRFGEERPEEGSDPGARAGVAVLEE